MLTSLHCNIYSWAVGVQGWPGRDKPELVLSCLSHPSVQMAAPQGAETPWLRITSVEEGGAVRRLVREQSARHVSIS